MIEEVDGQRTSLVGINASCGMPVMHEIEEELTYDHNLVFSTDSHEDPVDLNSVDLPSYDKNQIMETVEEARNSVKSTKAGIGEQTVNDIEILGIDGDYVIATVNLLLRLAPIFLILYLTALTSITFSII